MKLRAAARGSLFVVLLGAGCGRVSDDDGPSGGEGGELSTGGIASSGGASATGGSGAFGSGGKLQTGGTVSGGSPSTGGRNGTGGVTATGGAIATGGGKATGGTTNTGGVAGGEGGVGGVGSSYVPIGKSSWEVEMVVSLTSTPSSVPISCKSANFTLHVEPKAGGLSVLSGRDGSVMPGEFVLVPGATPSYKSSDLFALPSKGDCSVSSISVNGLTLEGVDFDGDGIADEISGEGKGSAMQILGDVGVTAQLEFALHGAPDAQPPALILPTTVHPLDGVRLFASEPVALGSKVTLKNGASSVALGGYTASDGALGSFSSPVVLPFASSWDIAVTGADLIGLPFKTSGLAPLQMLADPGVFAQDGFESTPKVLLVGNAAIVSGIGNLPAISGTKSLFVPPTGTATLHLARVAGKNNVRFTAQPLSSTNGIGVGAPPVQAGVYFGSERVRASAPTTAGTSSPTGDATWSYAGSKQAYTLTLSESEGDVVVLIAPPGCFGFCPLPQAILIDDLRVE
ncbi:MAG TPA: hypothetical protein VG937_33395 [Polyangiaceae bacterium]|nr:hypothetical protein [Polyangiaceae bacterium]